MSTYFRAVVELFDYHGIDRDPGDVAEVIRAQLLHTWNIDYNAVVVREVEVLGREEWVRRSDECEAADDEYERLEDVHLRSITEAFRTFYTPEQRAVLARNIAAEEGWEPVIVAQAEGGA